MTHHALIRRTRFLAALWLLALIAVASTDRVKRTCPSSDRHCSSQEGHGECSLELFKLTALPIRPIDSTSAGPGVPGPGIEITEQPTASPHQLPVPESGSHEPVDTLILAPKTSPPFFV